MARSRLDHPVPSYLIALAAGDLASREIGPRTAVYAEPPSIDAAAREFEDTEAMIAAVEELYGPYRWGRYDLLVLPPSFPFGGMENPLLTFATPTVIAGDKSLVSLIGHELAHSWSGNLVTNATWSDFWLNEGFTVYVERRILEKVYGRERAEMEAVLGRRELEREMARLPESDRILHIDLAGRDPDDGVTLVPYEKGALLLAAPSSTQSGGSGLTRFSAVTWTTSHFAASRPRSSSNTFAASCRIPSRSTSGSSSRAFPRGLSSRTRTCSRGSRADGHRRRATGARTSGCIFCDRRPRPTWRGSTANST